jgi:hypothetical protein
MALELMTTAQLQQFIGSGHSMELKVLKDDDVAKMIRATKFRAVYAAPGVTDTVAGALIEVRKRIDRNRVRVVLDGSANALRLGYGQTDPMPMLLEHDVDVRVEPGLRMSLLVVDDQAVVFMLPAMMVEDPNLPRGPNALILSREQVDGVLVTVAPDYLKSSPNEEATKPNPPQIGKQPLTDAHVKAVEAEMVKNPPQRFDLTRTLNVFNAYVEFIELRLTGLQITRHTVKLPQDLILALRDEATSKRLRTSFNLLDGKSKVGQDADAVEVRVRKLRDRFVRPIGDIGAITLRSKRKEVDSLIEAIRADIEKFRKSVVERLTKEIASSRNKLVEGLTPALKKKPPQDLIDQVTGKVTVEHVTLYLTKRLEDVFPTAESVVGDMKLECVRKGVTYETLASGDFQKKVRDAFPYEDWDKPFSEFTAAKAEQLPLLDQ